MYHTSWITSDPKSDFICENIATNAFLFFFGCSEVNSSWLITSELANQRARKVLFTCVVHTKMCYSFVRLKANKSRQFIDRLVVVLTRLSTGIGVGGHSKECQPPCRSSVDRLSTIPRSSIDRDRVSIEGINRHSITDPFSTHNPRIFVWLTGSVRPRYVVTWFMRAIPHSRLNGR